MCCAWVLFVVFQQHVVLPSLVFVGCFSPSLLLLFFPSLTLVMAHLQSRAPPNGGGVDFPNRTRALGGVS
jgi:hypothetical protein